MANNHQKDLMYMKHAGTYIAIMIVFGLGGLRLFSEGVRSVQVLGLFASGIVVGASLAKFIAVIRSKKSSE